MEKNVFVRIRDNYMFGKYGFTVGDMFKFPSQSFYVQEVVIFGGDKKPVLIAVSDLEKMPDIQFQVNPKNV